MTVWVHRDGDKWWSRNWLANGNFSGKPRGFRAKTVLSLTGKHSACIHQGMNLGYIRPDAKVFCVERDADVAKHIQQTAEFDAAVFHTKLTDFVPPRKIDMANIDLMGVCSHQLGVWLRDTLVPNMSSRRAGIGINLNIQRTSSSKDMMDFERAYLSDVSAWDRIWYQRVQRGVINHDTCDLVEPFTGIMGAGSGRAGLHSFVGIHTYLRDTPFQYRGCFRYSEASSPTAGVQYMLSLRYECP